LCCDQSGDVAALESPCSRNLDPCENGATCRVSGGAAVCTCAPGWQGVRCSSLTTEGTGGSPLSLTAIILIVVISVLILAVLAVVLALAMRRRRRRRQPQPDRVSVAASSGHNPLITYTGSGAGSNAWYPSYKNGAGTTTVIQTS
jgi:hypothetical protein